MDALRKDSRRERGAAGGFEDSSAAGGQGGSDFTHGEHEWEVTRADGTCDAYRGADNEMALFFDLVGDDASVDAPCFFGEPAQMVDGEGDFILALREGLSVFEGNDAGDFLAAAMEFRGD